MVAWYLNAQSLNFKPLVLGVRSLGLGFLTGPDFGWLAQLDSAWLGLAHLFQVAHPFPELVLIGSASHCLALAGSAWFWLNPNIENYLQESVNRVLIQPGIIFAYTGVPQGKTQTLAWKFNYKRHAH